ncbi:MAG: GGDEF domain-containing protein [Thermoleophilia bacterium]|nr:GGDEF domain-containing protein [Thermoleophilia bacterium]
MTTPGRTPAAALAAAERALVDAHDERAADFAARGLAALGGDADDILVAKLLVTRAVAAGNLGRPGEAATAAMQAMDAAGRGGDPVVAGHAAAVASFNLREDGHGARAVAVLLEAIAALDDLGDPSVGLVNAQVMVAQAAAAAGDRRTGRAFVERAVACAHATRDPVAQAHAMSADLRLRVRDALDAERRSPDAALRAHRQVLQAGGPTLAICDSAGDVAAAIDVRALLALSLASVGDAAAADRRLGEVARLCAGHDIPPERTVHLARARALLDRGAADEALAVLDDALRTPLDDIAGDRSSWIHLERANAHEMLGDLRSALAEVHCALRVERTQHLEASAHLADALAAHRRFRGAEPGDRDAPPRPDRVERPVDRDPVSGALTVAAFRERMDAVAGSGMPYAVVTVGVDRFPELAARFGAPVGDRVIATVAGLIAAACRRGDLVARSAADELLVGLPGVSPHEGAACAARIAGAVRSHPWTSIVPGLSVSVSVGVADAS